MSTLSQDLETLRELNEYRYKAKELREQSIYALNKIKEIPLENKNDSTQEFPPILSSEKDAGEKGPAISFKRWISSRDKVETSLLVKIQAHRDLSTKEEKNNEPRTQTALEEILSGLPLDELLLSTEEMWKNKNKKRKKKKKEKKKKEIKIPVLVAARVMQALLNRAEMVFKPATMKCYYRIIRELYGVAQPNWTVGAARAGIGGTTSAFVTNECIRAIFAFENALERTFHFFEQTHIFYKNFSNLEKMLNSWNLIGNEDHPLYIWINKTVEMMWLDCALSTNPRNREMALFQAKDDDKNKHVNVLLLPDDVEAINFSTAKQYFDSLPENLEKAVDDLFQNVAQVYADLLQYRQEEYPAPARPIVIEKDRRGNYKLHETYKFNDKKKLEIEEAEWREEEQFIRSATAHAFAIKVIEDAVIRARRLKTVFYQEKELENRKDTESLLKNLSDEFYKIKRRVHRVLEPSKQYLKWVINRELAAPKENFDAGELVFAATSYGAIRNWQMDDRLSRSCELLVNSLPDSGRLPTKRPFRTDSSGYRLIPIGCEMTRALANLLQKTRYEFDEKFTRKIFGLFNENLIELHESTAEKKLFGWNFEGAPDPDKPSLWVTATSVLALDRIIRMLNARINEIVLKHFDVTTCERPHTKMKLHDLIYSDYGLVHYDERKKIDNFTALNLQKMRAHIMRATLPKNYRKDEDEKNYSAIFYGPPGTGKTTLAESLALSSRVPLLKLSPSDLILQGQELIEGRAHDVFEALAMLTQCVIIFDEFEPVLKNRKTDDISVSQKIVPHAEPHDETKDNNYDIMRMSEAIQQMAQKDDPKFRFVLSGMLPKFGKLHDAAETQSFVYCMGTNIFKDIDEAAKRPGRFDKYFPVYKPDPLSRAGLLLYRLSQRKEFLSTASEKYIKGFIEFVAITANYDASRLNKFFDVNEKHNDPLGLILADRVSAFQLNETKLTENEIKKISEENRKDLAYDLTKNAKVDKEEASEREFLINYETNLAKGLEGLESLSKTDDLSKYLNGEKAARESKNS